jgi:diketogulonate reductase-like aldo/keto reductase
MHSSFILFAIATHFSLLRIKLNTEVSTTQIAINYIVAKGCVPMPSVKNTAEADEIIGCLGWSLSDDEVNMLDNAADMSDKGVVV